MGRPARRIAAPFGVIALVALVTCAAHVRAESSAPRAVTLRWGAPSGCPDRAYVEDEIGRLLAGSDAPARKLDVEADVAATPLGRWRVRLVTRSEAGRGERSLEAGSCRALADASALIVAMAVDPARVAANQAVAAAEAARAFAEREGDGSVDAGAPDASRADAEADRAPLPLLGAPDAGAPAAFDASVARGSDRDGAPPVASGEISASPSVSDRTAPIPPASFLIGAAVEADFGTLPNPGLAPILSAAWTPGSWRLDVAGAYFAKNHTAPLRGGGVGTFRLFAVDLRLCYDVIAGARDGRLGRFALGPCLGGEVASMSGTGEGIVAPSAGSSAWLALLGGGLVAFRLGGGWQLDLRLDAAVPLQRPEFRIDASTVHKPAGLTGRGVLGLGFRF